MNKNNKNFFLLECKKKNHSRVRDSRSFHFSVRKMKGLSAIITAVLIISIAVLLVLIIMNWVTVLVKDTTNTVSNKTAQCSSGADITVESVYLDFRTNISRINIRNSGLIDEEIISALLLAKDGQSANITNSTNTTILPLSLPRGSLKTIEFNITNKINSCDNFSEASVSGKCSSSRASTPDKLKCFV